MNKAPGINSIYRTLGFGSLLLALMSCGGGQSGPTATPEIRIPDGSMIIAGDIVIGIEPLDPRAANEFCHEGENAHSVRGNIDPKTRRFIPAKVSAVACQPKRFLDSFR